MTLESNHPPRKGLDMDHKTGGTAWERSAHDYEPGEATHPMQSSPLCAICGQARSTRVHSQEEPR